MSKSIANNTRLPDQMVRVGDRLHTLDLSIQTKNRLSDVFSRFSLYLNAVRVHDLAQVHPDHAEGFVQARSGVTGQPPSIATQHLRRTAIRLLFREARALGLAVSDPTLDLVLPARSSLRVRALTDDEVALCRAASLESLSETRRPAAWALAEAGATSAELPRVGGADVEVDSGRIWLSGSSRTASRWGCLTSWGCVQVQRRIATLKQRFGSSDQLIYGGHGSLESRQAASCIAISETLRLAGLAAEPDVRPASVRAWIGGSIFDTSGSIEEVARRLGLRSLDAAARLIGWQWQDEGSA